MAEVKEKCGIAAAFLPKPLSKYPKGGVVSYLYKMLLQQQHRGQLSAGISTYRADRMQMLDTYRDLGTVNEVFHSSDHVKFERIFDEYSGTKGIGHTRYATSGSDDACCAQPFERHHGRIWKWFSFGFNGNIANFSELKASLEKSKYHLVQNNDTELMMHMIAKQFIGDKKVELKDAWTNMSESFDGAYEIVYLNGDDSLVASRDPMGIRPLSYVISDDFVGAASETVALNLVSREDPKDIQPGEMLIVEGNDSRIERYQKCEKKAFCMFEWVYFSHPSSSIDGANVYNVRWNLGKELAKVEPLEIKNGDYVVVAVPDTARPTADGYAHELGVQAMEGLIRNRYIGRTFIESRNRIDKVKEKYSLNKAVLKDKKVILVDDSIVRGNTTKSVVEFIRREGKAKEVHVRVSCPPIKSPCFYGIDMSTMDELIGCRNLKEDDLGDTGMKEINPDVIESIRKEIGADTLVYQSLKGLISAIGLEAGEKDLCMACLNGHYPTPAGKELAKKAVANRGMQNSKRTYE